MILEKRIRIVTSEPLDVKPSETSTGRLQSLVGSARRTIFSDQSGFPSSCGTRHLEVEPRSAKRTLQDSNTFREVTRCQTHFSQKSSAIFYSDEVCL
jgi:hypothetical protein